MLKYFFILLAFISTSGRAQNTLSFDKRFVECEDKWVAFEKDNNDSCVFGFIYIDAMAGLTFNYEGKFKIDKEGVFIPKKLDNVMHKVRLQPNQAKVALIPPAKFGELQVSETPDWLANYKHDTGSVKRLHRWGFLYNSWDEPAKALTYLERGQKIDPKYKGLEFELAYAYNALGHYEKAIPVLESALETTPDDCLLYKELSFAEMHLGQLEKAVQTCKKGIPLCPGNALKAELAYNLCYQYYKAKDKVNFKNWADETKKWASSGDQFMKAIEQMEININK